MTHSCNHCKTEFQQKRRNQFYCSQSCRQLAYINRKYATNLTEKKSADQLAGLTNMLGNVNPEMLMQILSAAVNNPSMTDKLTDKAENAVKPHDTAQNPSQNVNNNSVYTTEKSVCTTENTYEKYLKTLKPENNIRESGKSSSAFDEMIKERYTIPIGPNGYMRSLFPHWENKDWFLSVYVNEKMLAVFECLRKGSNKNVISYKTLTACYEQLREFSVGSCAHCLPHDYPFTLFIRFLMYRLEALIEKAKGLKEIKFRVPDDLREMMSIITTQLNA